MLKENELVTMLGNLDFFRQSKELGDYYPTENLITTLVNESIGLIYLIRHYSHWNEEEERDIFICYSSQKI